MIKTTLRGEILETARGLTEGDRNKSYNEPSVQLGLAGLLKDTLWEYFGDHGEREIGPGEREAIDQVLTKVSRVVVGREVKRDNYVDMAAYAAIAGECAEKDMKADFAFGPLAGMDWSKLKGDETALGEAVAAKPDDISDAGVPKDAAPGTFGGWYAKAREARIRERTAKICSLNWPDCPMCRKIAEREL